VKAIVIANKPFSSAVTIASLSVANVEEAAPIHLQTFSSDAPR